MDTHGDLLAPVSNSKPIFDDLCRRNSNIINSLISVIGFWVRSIAVHSVSCGSMSSSLCLTLSFL